MRLLFPLMLILLGIVLIGFLITNPQRVEVTVLSQEYSNVPLALVALVALTVGVAFTAAVALAEGATIRLANLRLRREIQRLEAENGFLRSQSLSVEAGQPALPDPLPVEDESFEDVESRRPASAPVYDPARLDSTDYGNG